MNYEEIINDMLRLADEADMAGNTEHADKIAAILPQLGLLKKAQYEGGQSYWLLNGRAFEKAYKEKREKKNQGKIETLGDMASAQEAWLEVLEEYQDALLGNEDSTLKKHAASKQAASEIMQEISSRLLDGNAPGVAIYEAIHHFASGQYEKDVLASVDLLKKEVMAKATK